MLPITKHLLDNYNRPKTKLTELKAIVVHYTANTNPGAHAMANRNYFNTQPHIINKKTGEIVYASAHYIVDDKTIIQCIPDDEVAYHVGAKSYKELIYTQIGIPRSGKPNNYTIGIEMCVNSDGDYPLMHKNTIDLIRFLLDKYRMDRKNLFRHYDITGKKCPLMFIEEAKWLGFLNEIDGTARVTPDIA
jgi:N-acetylmuramoyl-L-alanine amidase